MQFVLPAYGQNNGESNNDSIASEANKIIGSSTTPLLKGQITYVVPSGTPIKLKLATVPSLGLKMLNRDMDGNLNPAELDQEITAKTTEDIYVDDNKVIPEGTVFHGKVSKIYPPRRVGRPGSLVISFDSFKTPDGRKFAFRVEANNEKVSTKKSKAKGLGIIAAHAAGGAAVGAIFAYAYCGLEQTIAMHGYNIAGAAAAGALMGIGVALFRHGPKAVLEPGDDFNMQFDRDLLIPAAVSPTQKAPPNNLPGLSMNIVKSKIIKDGLNGHLIKLETLVINNTNTRLKSIDLFLEDDNGTRFPVVADSDENSELIFDIEPRAIRRVKFDFQVEFPKLKRKLIWLDHGNRHILFEMPLP
jgi:hypothetical protein